MTNKSIAWPEALFLLLSSFFLICFRDVDFLKSPTFWGDETRYLFAKAYNYGWSSIWMPHAGYAQIPQMFFNNLANTFGGLEYAPFFTAWSCNFLQMIPILIIVFGNSRLDFDFIGKCILCFISILASEDGNSYSTMNMHFIFSWITALIYFENEPKTTSAKITYIVLLFLSPLSGPIPSIFLPFFGFSYLEEKKSHFLVLFLVIGISFMLSFIVFLHRLYIGDPEIYGSRFMNFNLGYFTIRYLLFTLIGNSLGYFEEINRPFMFLAWFLFFRILVIEKQNRIVWELAIAVFLTSIIPFVLSRGMDGGHRYVYAANLMFICMLLFYTKLHQNERWILYFTGFLLIGSALSYSPKHVNMTKLKPISWSNEVAKWKKDPSYKLKTYPYQQWDTTQPWTMEILVSTKDQ